MPNPWLNGVVAFLPKKNDLTLLQNYRPTTHINIIYKLWAIIMTKRLTPYIWIASLMKLKLHIKKAGPKLISATLPKIYLNIANINYSYSLTYRMHLTQSIEIYYGPFYLQKGIPWEMTNRLRMGHIGNKLCPKYKGATWKYTIKIKDCFKEAR